MSNDKRDKMVQAFYFNAHTIRTIVREKEEFREWFVAADVCKALGLSNVTLALDGHPNQPGTGLEDDEKGFDTINTPGGVQQVRKVSESGLYRLVFKSRKPEAKHFQRWVTHEVLPELRRKGVYALNAEGRDYNSALSLLPGMIEGARRAAEAIGLPYDNTELVVMVFQQWEDKYDVRVPPALGSILERATDDPLLPEAVDNEEYMNLYNLCRYFGVTTKAGNPHTLWMSRLLKHAQIHNDARFGKAVSRNIRNKSGRIITKLEWLYASHRVESYLEQRYGAETWMWPTYLPEVHTEAKRHHAVRHADTKIKAWWVSMKAPFEYVRLSEDDIDQLEFENGHGRVSFGVDTVNDGNVLVICRNDETLHSGFSAIWEHLHETDGPMCREFCKNYNLNDRTGDPLPPKLIKKSN